MNTEDPSVFLSFYKIILKENNALQKTINFIKETYSTDNQKIQYGNDQIDWFDFANYYLFFLYYFFLIILFFVVFLRRKFNFITFTTLGGLSFFPFFITSLEMRLYDIIVYISTFLFGEHYAT